MGGCGLWVMDDILGVPDAAGWRWVPSCAGMIRKKRTQLTGLCFVFFVLRRLRLVSRFVCLSVKKGRSAPLPDKPSDRGLFGFPEDTGAAPITGAPAAHCLKLLRHGLENLAGSDRKHHEYVPVLDCTVADGFWIGVMDDPKIAGKLMK
jgi:hypothetical protein